MKLKTFFTTTKQDYTKKLIELEFQISEDYDDYILNHLSAIKDINNNKFDMLTHKNSTFIFYHLNNYLSQINEPIKLIPHTIISDNVLAFDALQKRNWLYFIERLLEVTHQQEIKIDGLEGLGTIEEIQIINHSIENITISKEAYNNLFNVVADCLQDYFNYIESEKLEEIKKDLMLNYFFINSTNQQNAYQTIRAYSHFFYGLEHFPGD